ncbi:MAG: sodium:proton antiporter, partial [Anaerovoracaceae bacterium]
MNEIVTTVPIWLCIPFAGLLLCIALLPLIRPKWWEEHQGLVSAVWIAAMAVTFCLVYGAGKTAETVLECIVNDYLTFIVLLFGLFCVSGNITMEGDFAGSPRVNVGLLAMGTLLASCIGTTGASMLMVRPVIKMNAWRKRKKHIMVFFIFMVSNMGGCLTPIGDPPLLMGFMRGVPFFWSLKLLPVLLFNMVILLFVFYHLDKRAYRKDIAQGRKPDISKPYTEFRIDGLHNLLFIV